MSVKKQPVSSNINFQPVPTSDHESTSTGATDEDNKGTSCGIGSFKPTWLQVFNNPKVFLLNHSILGIIQGTFFTYLVGTLSTLEKRYAYETKVTGIIMISDEISPILFGALLGYFGGKSHRPRIVSLGMMVGMLSCFVMALPYFIYGSATHLADRTSIFDKNRAELCDDSLKDVGCVKSTTFTAVSLLFFGNFLKGVGSLAFYTIGTSFLDDSVEKKNSPLYFGTLFALRLLGPVLGFLLSSFCLQYYEDPFCNLNVIFRVPIGGSNPVAPTNLKNSEGHVDPGFTQSDPRWVGAWWLGYVIMGVGIFIVTLPMMLFPRQFPSAKLPEKLRKKKKKEKVQESFSQQIKGMGKALKRLGQNPILICHYLGGVLRLNGVVGYYVLLPKYMEMQFRQSASKASLYSGPASIVSMQIGILIGGYAIRRCKPRPRVLTGGILFAETFSVIGLLVCMLITCPMYQMTGTTMADNNRLNLKNSCNMDAHCSCTTKVFTPICGPDGKSTYFSPCFAGCSGYNNTGDKEIFTDCKCVHDEFGSFTEGVADKNYCNSECQWMITFIVILSIGKFLSSTARVGNTIVTLRCVDQEDKSIALGTLSGAFSLLAFIPYPLIYGALTDASCLVWEESCGQTGNCWIYDVDKFRFLLHGVSAMFVFCGCITDIFVCILSPRLKNLYDEDNEDADKDNIDMGFIQNPEIANNGGTLGVCKFGVQNVTLLLPENERVENNITSI